MYTMTIHMIDGESIQFSGELPEWRLIGLSSDIEKAQSRNVMGVELDGKLLMIPYTSIRYIEIDPVPPELPKHILRGSRSV